MSLPSTPPRRSVLYVPAANSRAMSKASTLDCDAVVFDLEDAVAPSAKSEARRNLVEAFRASDWGHRETVIRVNAPATPEFTLDMDAVSQCAPHAVLLPKVEQPSAFHLLDDACRARRMGPELQAWAMVETPAGLIELDQLVRAGVNSVHALNCLVVGTNDLVKDTGVSADHHRAYLLPWLMHVVLVARRRGLTVLDGVWNDFADMIGFQAEAAQGREMGFDGKTLIHPAQISPSNQTFMADPDRLAWAHLVVQAFAQDEHAQAGVINLQGKMVERLHLSQAMRLLAMDAAIRTRQSTTQ